MSPSVDYEKRRRLLATSFVTHVTNHHSRYSRQSSVTASVAVDITEPSMIRIIGRI